MLARRLTTLLPAMTLAEAMETTCIHSVAGLTGDRTALVTTRPFRAPPHTISDAGLIGEGQVPMEGDVCRWPTMACSFWMSSPSAAAMSWKCCGNRSRRVLYTYNLASALNSPRRPPSPS
jgi:Magnesium chelatase, subunit ChlI